MLTTGAIARLDVDRWTPFKPAREEDELEQSNWGAYRRSLVRSEIALVEDSSVSPHMPAPSGHTDKHQIILPYLGVFEFRVGRTASIVDPNRTLFAIGGRDFADKHPVRNVGHASVIITPAFAVLDELCGRNVLRHPAFERSTQPATARLALLTQRLLSLRAHNDNPLANDELTLAALRESLRPRRERPSPARIVDRAKQVLHARGCERITLDQIASEVGVSPIYLTQEFTRSEGMPLYRYQTRLRLSRALVELSNCDNITSLALDLGFSSHSHFSAVFKAAFGVTPSQVRDWA